MSDNVSPLIRSAVAVELKWEDDRRVDLMRRLGFVGTRVEALLAYAEIKADIPPTTCNCGLCR